MEEYRDLDLTVEAFCRVLDEPTFTRLPAGIVLQAYLPDTHAVLDRLVEWVAGTPPAAAAAPVKVRLVKGANLAMEHVDAELGGWTPAPYATKAEVDASYKALLDRLLDARRGRRPARRRRRATTCSTWPGRSERERRASSSTSVEIEMLEGMAPPQSRAMLDEAGGVLLYTPVVTDEDFAASIAYLSRRLDENAGPENFLRSLFTITPGSPVVGAPSGSGSSAPSRAAPDVSTAPRAATRTARTEQRRVRSRRAVRQRARHRLHAGRQPGVDRRATCATTARPTLPPLADDDGRHRRRRRPGPRRRAALGGDDRPPIVGAALEPGRRA